MIYDTFLRNLENENNLKNTIYNFMPINSTT